jgi:hypothetical protein
MCQRQKLALSRVRRLSDLMLFGTDQWPEHGMNSDSRKPFFIQRLFFLCSLGKAELSLGLSYQTSLWTGVMPNYLGAKHRI